MEEHQQHHHPIIQQYGITDLRHLIDPPLQLQSQPSFETVMMMNRPISAAEITPNHHHHQTHYGLIAAPTSSLSGGGGFEVAGDAGTGRWPRQETLTLLEIRSRLDSKFKDANQKGPLWDEVSRVMSEEHGYQRSGKKCREKFENLYKYYKKTKEGKAGRQDGKHYRFFRQLEALYGETSNNNNNIINNNSNPNDMNDNQVSHNYNSLGLFHAIPTPREASNNNIDNDSSESFDSSYSSDDNAAKRRPRGWKAKIKEFVDSHMKKLMERQEAWLEKLMRTLEQKERERDLREEEWRREEASRVEREHRFWAKERAWIEARDSALMEALKSLNPRKSSPNDQEEEEEEAEVGLSSRPELGFLNLNWTELEISRLIELRTGIESRFDGGEDLWDDVASKMACLGHDRSGSACREKWESINSSSNNNSDRNSKKRKENGNYNNFLNNVNNNESSTSLYNHGGYENCDHMNDGTSSSPSNANVGHSMNSHDHHHNHHHNHNHVVGHDGCFPFFMGEGSENLWESYGVKISKGGQNI